MVLTGLTLQDCSRVHDTNQTTKVKEKRNESFNRKHK
jgi:hypothetical protein